MPLGVVVFEVVVDAENQIVGTVGLYPLDTRNCELRKMYLLPACRGQGMGTNSATIASYVFLYHHVVTIFREKWELAATQCRCTK